MRFPAVLLFLAVATGFSRAAEVAISIRYLQPKGKSHAAIYLFHDDGRLLRQLSQPGEGQDVQPAFAPGGREIVFQRVKDIGEPPVFWSVKRDGKGAHSLKGEAPAWHAGRKMATAFTAEPEEVPAPTEDVGVVVDGPETMTSPDGGYEIEVRPNPKADPHELSQRVAFLRKQGGAWQPFAEMPGYAYFWFVVKDKAGSPFFFSPGQHVAFFCGEHDSTTGTNTFALDLDAARIVMLSENGATPYRWAGHAGFWCSASSRYEPFGEGHTVNCFYLDRYDAKLQRIRFATKAHGIFYGASIFTEGEKPLEIPEDDAR